jgi:CDP-glucose 4,6-dehydratase
MEDLVMIRIARTSPDFWRGKRVLLTGHTGFKGSWMAIWLHQLGAEVTGISLPPDSEPNLFSLAEVNKYCQSHYCDIRDAAALASLVRVVRPEVIFHLAAQPLVRASYLKPLETFSTNVMGTANVLDALCGQDSVRVAMMVTTDKVYRNMNKPYPCREDDALGGHDPYSASKSACEIVIASYRDAFLTAKGIAVASARAGNVIGGGDWSKDRLIPDAVRAWQADKPIKIRNPKAIRPWQHVIEPLAGYLKLAQKLFDEPVLAGAYNFGPEPNQAATVEEVVKLACTNYGAGRITYENNCDGPHEAPWLALETAKARVALGVTPKWALTETVRRTMGWYLAQHEGQNARKLCEAEITDYETLI